jgi:hypothetical protein
MLFHFNKHLAKGLALQAVDIYKANSCLLIDQVFVTTAAGTL